MLGIRSGVSAAVDKYPGTGAFLLVLISALSSPLTPLAPIVLAGSGFLRLRFRSKTGRSRYTFFYSDCPHFITCTVIKWIAVFGNVEVSQIVLNSLKFLIENKRLTLHGWGIMENHLHVIASASDLLKEIHDFKFFTAGSRMHA